MHHYSVVRKHKSLHQNFHCGSGKKNFFCSFEQRPLSFRLMRPISLAPLIGYLPACIPWDQAVWQFLLRPVSLCSLKLGLFDPWIEGHFVSVSRDRLSLTPSIGSMSVSFPWDLFLPSLPSLETSVARFFDRQHVRLFPLRPVSSVSPVSGDQCRPLLRSAACPSLSLETCFFRLSRLWRPVSPASSIGSMSVSFPWDLFLPSLPSLETSVARFFDRQHVRLFPLRPVSSISPVSGDQCHPLLRSAACPSLSLETCFFRLSRLWRPVSPASSIGSMSVSFPWDLFLPSLPSLETSVTRFFDRQHVRLFPLRPVSSVSPVSGDQCHPLLRSAACPSLSLETCFFLLSRLWRPVSPASSIGSMSVSFPWDLFLLSLPSLETSVTRFFDRQHVRLFPLRPVSSFSPVSGDQCHPLLRSAACPSLSLETCFFCLSRLWRPVSPASSIGSMSVSFLETCFFLLSRLWRPVSPASSIGSMSVSILKVLLAVCVPWNLACWFLWTKFLLSSSR